MTRVLRNDWSILSPPAIGAWTPTRSVSVVIPAYNCQASLDLVLAALSRQTYPDQLLEVIVVDDRSQPELQLPTLRPTHCQLVRVTRDWGIAGAVELGARRATGEVLHRLDADMLAAPEHVEALVRWLEVCPDAVVLGYKRFVEADGWPTPDEVAERDYDQLFTGGEPHDYIERLIDSTDQLRSADHLGFLALVGATFALSRELYRAAGGLDTRLELGEDTEFGYRLAQAGAVFIPEPAARAWHLGRSSMALRGKELRRYNRPFLAHRMPLPRYLREAAGRIWRVPLVTAVVTATGRYEVVRTCVDRLLASDVDDLRVLLAGAWEALDYGRRDLLADPWLDLRLIEANYATDPRVEITEVPPENVFPSPYRLDLPATAGVGPSTVGELVAAADRDRAGLVRAGELTLWRTSAVSRAGRTMAAGESLMDAVSAVHGRTTVDNVDVVDLGGMDPDQLTSPTSRRYDRDVVVVGGVRSLLKAARLVARKQLRRR
jgi:GT2 family glycosyltransferase